ncbi:MAG: DoxX family protein [Actinobacteria bacterium]|uniref:Unannotated protein n=1 Tax=freshwater metagenome TaxID=449393 RepID=A0A6J6I1X6_9ZZZZ|nr:DoxX family protein [Actinomycetota bacterium]
MGKLPIGTWILIAMFTASGVLHLLSPESFAWLMWPMNEALFILLITASGIAELICAVGLLLRHPWAGRLTALTLIAVWPANIWYAFDVIATGQEIWLIIAAWVRLPLQVLLIWFAWKSPKKYSRSQTLKYLQ